jgi:curved DNA-binding protein CbpA
VKASTKPFLKAERILLGVEDNATKRAVKNAYRRKARKLHPDVGGDAEAFRQLYAAYRAVLRVARD